MKYHVLQKHTDNSEKPWQCQTCGKGFVHENKLKEHINVHTSAKPFKCRYCPSRRLQVWAPRLPMKKVIWESFGNQEKQIVLFSIQNNM